MNRLIFYPQPCKQPHHGRSLTWHDSAVLPLLLFAVFTLVGLSSCDTDAYESGDTSLSYLRADFVMAQTGLTKQVVGATNDDGERLLFDKPFECEWTTTADSTYRALLYYKNRTDEAPQPISLLPVLILEPKPLKVGETDSTDPVTWESAWLSKQQPYLNMSILIKTGVEEGLDAKQVVGIIPHGDEQQADGTTIHHLSFFHQQNGVPEYYTSRVYVSVPTKNYRSGDIIMLTVNTYNGIVERDFKLE